MSGHVLITGGAGFIGSHLADELLRGGHRVRVLDNLSPQVHGPERQRPDYLHGDVELMVGDVRNRAAVDRALEGVDAVYHFAAAVGVGQSMYRVEEYTSINNIGTAVLMEGIVAKKQPLRRLVVASSMSIYGEGLYQDSSGVIRAGSGRDLEQLKRGEWEMRAASGEILAPVPTPESKEPCLESVYALSKYDQERLTLILGRAYGIPAVALRFFNVFGPRQALSNPYTGVLAIFAARLLNGAAPMIFEDGLQRRDFVSVYDVARASALALDDDRAVGEVINIGSGRSFTVREVAEKIARATGQESLAPEISGKYRMGDVRHCFADIGRAHDLLGYTPQVAFEEGMAELAGMAAGACRQGPRARGAGGARIAGACAVSILVTGGAGFIGSNVVARLLEAGERVVVLDNLSRGNVQKNIAWLRERFGDRLNLTVGDVRDAAGVTSAVHGATHVYHFAAQVAVTTSLVSPIEDFEVNARGTLNVLEAMRTSAAPPSLVFTSTNKVYGGLDDLGMALTGQRYTPIDSAVAEGGIGEARPLDFHSPYGCSKGAADQYVLDYARCFGLRACVFRMSCIYGPRQFGTEDQGWVAHFLIRHLRGEGMTVYGDGRQVRDLLFIDDLVDAFEIARRDLGGGGKSVCTGQVFNMGGGPSNTLSLLELFARMETLQGRPPALTFEPWRTGDQRYYVSNTRKFEELTGWSRATPVDEGIRRLDGWLREAFAKGARRGAERVEAAS